MPSIEDWVNSPLKIVQNLYDQHGTEYTNKVKEYFSKKLEERNALSCIPSLNQVALHELPPNSLVKFRCMIQDMFDPEFYLGLYEVKNKQTGKGVMKVGQYKDIAECQADEEVQVSSERNVTMDRQQFYCVPIPGEADWVKKEFSKSDQAIEMPSTSSEPVRSKRCFDEEPSSPCSMVSSTCSTLSQEMSPRMEDTEMVSSPSPMFGESKKSKPGESNAAPSSQQLPDLNFPLPGEKGPACLVKLYDDSDTFKVNDTVEFVGVLSVDPSMAKFPSESVQLDFVIDPLEDMMDMAEHNAHSPPSSLVPRLHAVMSYKLEHVNPYLPRELSKTPSQSCIESILSQSKVVRKEVISLLEQALFGDNLAAEYLLCHLISSVYARRDVVAVGKFSLNIIGCPKPDEPLQEYAPRLYHLIGNFVTKHHFLPMSLDFMKAKLFSPRKDYSANRLVSGILQLASRTHLVIDETRLQQGQLDATGVKNVTALGNLISWQKVDYDFNYHTQEFTTNVPVLILSEGKSLLPSDCRVHLTPCLPLDNMSYLAAVESYLTPSLLTKIRSYIGLLSLIEYSMSDGMQKSLEEDFVEARKDNAQNMSVEDFHGLLVLARLLSLSYGQTNLSKDMWEKAKQMDRERKARIPK
ncbi:mini-chromosome maintenance complex-binding protein-like isoform X2 [Lineus longissimus]|uniref:mini-chromosome maintenance complex-binding protein-like isoform X2 n=1 Tax=Lineus longissimus TaxID=88925 RepID=UPI00315C8D3A